MIRTGFSIVAILLASLAVVLVGHPTRGAGEALGSDLQGRTKRLTTAPLYSDSCTEEVRIFNSLRDGDFDFCRLKLGYVPGRFDCLRVVTTTCTSLVFDGQSWVPRTLVDARTQRIACPRGPVPPSCPSGIPEPLD